MKGILIRQELYLVFSEKELPEDTILYSRIQQVISIKYDPYELVKLLQMGMKFYIICVTSPNHRIQQAFSGLLKMYI